MFKRSVEWRSCLVLGGVLSAAMACGDGTAVAPGEDRLVRMFAPAAADSIDAEPATAYVVRAVDGEGQSIVATSVTFTAVNALVAVPGSAFSSSVSAMTDSQGQVAVNIRFGEVAGAGLVTALVQTLQLADTLSLEVAPGAAHTAAIEPADTVVVVGTEFSVLAFPVDRRGHMAGDPLALTVLSGPVEKDGDTFTSDRFGMSELAADVGGDTLTTTVTVVPDGEIVYTIGSEAWLAHLDGTGAQQLAFTVPGAQEQSIDWNPAGNRVAVGGTGGFTVFDLEAEAVLPGAWPGGVAGTNVIWPRFGPGGKVWYSSSDSEGSWDVREMNPDGTEPAITIESNRFAGRDFFPAWTPDGSQFAFTADWEMQSRFLLRISNADVSSVATLNVEGVTPVWSPDGMLIAYQELGLVGVVAPDLSTDSSWSVGWRKGVTWSPDGGMLTGVDDDGDEIAILDVATGETLTLPWFGSVSAVAWRPM